MGACDFYTRSKGSSAKAAFANAVEEAQYESGHGGYTGTIAEKHSFVVVANGIMSRDEASALARKLVKECDERIDDKWGPAGAIQVASDEWLFFGWASS